MARSIRDRSTASPSPAPATGGASSRPAAISAYAVLPIASPPDEREWVRIRPPAVSSSEPARHRDQSASKGPSAPWPPANDSDQRPYARRVRRASSLDPAYKFLTTRTARPEIGPSYD